jgi:hypothetical protein
MPVQIPPPTPKPDENPPSSIRGKDGRPSPLVRHPMWSHILGIRRRDELRRRRRGHLQSVPEDHGRSQALGTSPFHLKSHKPMTAPENPPAFPKCSRCGNESHIKQGNSRLCVVHYRFATMRSNARRHGKLVPTTQELEGMIPDRMICPTCSRTMNWLQKEGASTVVSLQHDRSGRMRLLCLACNTRHAQHSGDSFYDLGHGMKVCRRCKEAKPLSAFSQDRHKPIGRVSYCKPCASIRHKEWRSKHAIADALLAARKETPTA